MRALYRRLRSYGTFLFTELIPMNVRLLAGMWKLFSVQQPSVTVFGGTSIPIDHPAAREAERLAGMLAESGFSIITGGGPGIMEAANKGAIGSLKSCSITNILECKPFVSVGIGLTKLSAEHLNPFVQKSIIMGYFFERKWLLVRHSMAFVVCPGGFGTLDELFELTTLIKCRRMPQLPVILLCKDYWQPLIDWLQTKTLHDGLITKDDLAIISIVDSADHAAIIIKEFYAQQPNNNLTPSGN